MTDIVQHFHKDEQSMKTLKKRKVDGQKLTNKINVAKRLTAGVLFNAEHITMDEEVLDIVAKKMIKETRMLWIRPSRFLRSLMIEKEKSMILRTRKFWKKALSQ